MHLVGRHTMTRLYGAQGISARHVLSRPRAQWPATLTRYCDEDWAVSPEGTAYPAIRGGAGWLSSSQVPRVTLADMATVSSVAQQTVALNTNYVFNTSGNAIASRVVTPGNKTLSAVYYFVTAHTGTPEVQIDLHTDGSSKPAASPTALGNSTPGGTGWKNLGSLSAAFTAGTKYWVVVSDNDGSTDGTATVLRNVNGPNLLGSRTTHTAFATTDGWASVVTVVSAVGAIVLVFNDSTALGWPITSSATPTNNTNRRGWNLSTGLTDTCKILGLVSNAGVGSGSGIEAYEGATLPGGTTAASGTTSIVESTAAGGPAGFLFSTPYAAPANTALRLVYTFSANSQAINRLQYGTGVDATLKLAIWGAGSYYYAWANGTTDWSNDDTNELPGTSILIEDLVAPSASGGGLVVGPGVVVH